MLFEYTFYAFTFVGKIEFWNILVFLFRIKFQIFLEKYLIGVYYYCIF